MLALSAHGAELEKAYSRDLREHFEDRDALYARAQARSFPSYTWERTWERSFTSSILRRRVSAAASERDEARDSWKRIHWMDMDEVKLRE